ncbi:MAG: hypothetical protein JWQ02_2643 [Capsulimonas sp.]|nr:hypothetical protein [Capsulimonas sp.]
MIFEALAFFLAFKQASDRFYSNDPIMTQNSHPGSSMPARGFSRRAFAPRSPRPRFRPVDTLWLTTLAILSLAATVIRFGSDALGDIGPFAAAATVAGLYFIGWRTRDRSTGVIAGVLLAVSLTYSGSLIGHPATAIFTLLSVGALAAMAGGQLIAAALLAAVASVIRPDGLLLGAALLCMPPPDDDSRLRWRPIGLFLITTALGALLAYSLRYTPPRLMIGVNPYLVEQAMLGGNAVLAWFLWPFLAELGEPMRRQRWLPFIVWTVLYIAAESLFYYVQPGQSWPPLAPIFALLIGGGMSRLIPVLAGEFANPTMRYVLATLAVVSLFGVRVALDWPHARLIPTLPTPSVETAAMPPTPQVSAPKPKPATHPVAATPATHPVVPVPIPAPLPTHPIATAPTTIKTPPPTPISVIPAPTPAVTVTAPPAKPTTVPHHVVVVPGNAVAPQPGAPQIPDSEGENNSVRTYTWKNGRLVKRNRWAIDWDRKQLALAKQREAAAHGAPATASATTPPMTAPTPAPATTAPIAVHPKPVAPKPATVTRTRKPVAVTPKPVGPTTKPVMKPVVTTVKPVAKPVVKRVVAKRPAWKPRVRQRSIWAIRWEQAHKKAR